MLRRATPSGRGSRDKPSSSGALARETIRTSLVQGPENTVQTYIWSTYKQVGLSPALYALMSLLIVLTVALVAAFVVGGARTSPAASGVNPRGR